MEKIIVLLLVKYKVFLYGFLTGTVLQYFEIQAGNIKFNIGRFIISSVVFGMLAEFSNLMIKGNIVGGSDGNESRIIVLSIMIASFLYLFIPFVLKPENRGKFIISILKRFGFEKSENNKKITK